MGSLLEQYRTGENSFGDKGSISPTSDPGYTKGRLVSLGSKVGGTGTQSNSDIPVNLINSGFGNGGNSSTSGYKAKPYAPQPTGPRVENYTSSFGNEWRNSNQQASKEPSLLSAWRPPSMSSSVTDPNSLGAIKGAQLSNPTQRSTGTDEGHTFSGIPAQDGTLAGMLANRKAIINAGGAPGYQAPLKPDYNAGYDRSGSSVFGDLVHDTGVGAANKFVNLGIATGNLLGQTFGNKEAWRDKSSTGVIQKEITNPTDAAAALAKTKEMEAQKVATQSVQASSGLVRPALEGFSTDVPTEKQYTDHYKDIQEKHEAGYWNPKTPTPSSAAFPNQPGVSAMTPNQFADQFHTGKPSERLQPFMEAALASKPGTPESYRTHAAYIAEVNKIDAEHGNRRQDHVGEEVDAMRRRAPEGLVLNPKYKNGFGSSRFNEGDAGNPTPSDAYVTPEQASGLHRGPTYTDMGANGQPIPGMIAKYDGQGGLVSMRQYDASPEAQARNAAANEANEARRNNPLHQVEQQLASKASGLRALADKYGENVDERRARAAENDLLNFRSGLLAKQYDADEANKAAVDAARSTAQYKAAGDTRVAGIKAGGLVESARLNAGAKQANAASSADNTYRAANLKALQDWFPADKKTGDNSDLQMATQIMDRSNITAAEFAANPERVLSRINKVMQITKKYNADNTHSWRPDGAQMEVGGIGALNHEIPEGIDGEGLMEYYKHDPEYQKGGIHYGE